MMDRFEEQYRGYRLKCRPQMSGDGRFYAYLVIAHGSDPELIDLASTLDLASLPSAGLAADAARAAGRAWVDEALGVAAGRRREPRRGAEPAWRARELALSGSASARL